MKKKKDMTPLPLKILRWTYPRMERYFPSLAHRYLLKAFFSPLHYPTPEKEKKSVGFAGLFNVEAAGKKIQGYQWGDDSKPYILFVHGWAGRATQFRRFVKPMLAAGYRVVAFDGPAHGRSEGKTTSLIEFEEAIRKIYTLKGQPEAIIAHSFGGGACLFSAMHGLPIKKLINIASPTIGQEIINTYLAAINGSDISRTFIDTYMMQQYGKPFDEFTSLHFIRHLPYPLSLMLIHDEDDKEVRIRHSEELIKVYPAATLLRTTGLGHTRILKDNDVIRACVTFIQRDTSVEEVSRASV